MNILLVNWTWYPSGGDWTYVDNMTKLYEQNGHQVVPFSMHNAQNLSTPYSKYFVKNIDYNAANRQNKISGAVKVLSKSIYSFEAVTQLKKLLKDVKIELAHLNLIHRYITPSILKVLKEAGIPIIWTIHDYTILCPESTFVSHEKICEACKVGKFYNASLKRCKKNSFLASAVASFDNYIQHYLNYYRYVDYFISPSKFHFEKFKEYGFFRDKLHQIYHSYDVNKLSDYKDTVAVPEKYILFVGRLEKIKGTHTLLEAMKSCKEIKLKIVGDGSQENELKNYVALNQLNNVSFLGKMNHSETRNLIKYAEFIICPSEWYEVLGFTIIEAMLLGKPVIGASIGAIPETVIHEETGLLFEAGNAKQLADQIVYLYHQPVKIKLLGKQAKAYILELTNPNFHYQELQKIVPVLR